MKTLLLEIPSYLVQAFLEMGIEVSFRIHNDHDMKILRIKFKLGQIEYMTQTPMDYYDNCRDPKMIIEKIFNDALINIVKAFEEKCDG